MKIKIEKVALGYGDNNILENINFELNKGNIYGLIGSNGVGKTTLMRAILGLMSPKSGLIEKNDIDNREISYLPEERGINLNLTVYYHILYMSDMKGVSKKNFDKKIDQLLEMFELLDKKSSKIKTLSKGNKQKVLIIITLINDPKLLVLDEPFNGLDPSNINLFKKSLKKLKINNNSIILVSSHNLNILEEICDDFILIENQTVKKIKNHYNSTCDYTVFTRENIEKDLLLLNYIEKYHRDGEIVHITLKAKEYEEELKKFIKKYNISGFITNDKIPNLLNSGVQV